jgi:hypothetical protein
MTYSTVYYRNIRGKLKEVDRETDWAEADVKLECSVERFAQSAFENWHEREGMPARGIWGVRVEKNGKTIFEDDEISF